jgi:hypothetical protein
MQISALVTQTTVSSHCSSGSSLFLCRLLVFCILSCGLVNVYFNCTHSHILLLMHAWRKRILYQNFKTFLTIFVNGTEMHVIPSNCTFQGSIGMMFGFKFRWSCGLFLGPYMYFFLLDKSRWNNHSYLFALFTLLMMFSGAGNHMYEA